MPIYIYIDESGDLGFSEKSSNYFIIAGVKINDEKVRLKFEHILVKIKKKKLKIKEKKKSEFKFSNSKFRREEILTEISNLNLGIYALIIEKNKIQEKLKGKKTTLYKYLLKNLLEMILSNIKFNEKIKIYIDKSLNNASIFDFNNYLKEEFILILAKTC